jgi:DNA-binding XRE family transcriptional regulator
MANSKSDERRLAREYFLSTDKSQAEIAQLVGVNQKTISQWKDEEKWELLKAATNVTPRKTIAGFLMQLEEMRKTIETREYDKVTGIGPWPTSKESDSIMKISKSVKMLSKSLTITDYIMAFEELTRFGVNLDGDLTKQFIDIINEFVQVKVKEIKES